MRIIRRAEVRSRSGYSDMHIYRLEKVGKFPKRIQIGPNAVGWLDSEVDDWIAEKIAARDVAVAAKSADQGGG